MSNEMIRWLRVVSPPDGQLGGFSALRQIHASSRDFGRLEDV